MTVVNGATLLVTVAYVSVEVVIEVAGIDALTGENSKYKSSK